MPCALLDAHAIAQRKIGSAPSCLRSAAWLHLNLGAVLFQPGDKACSDIASTYRKERSPTRNALASELPFTFFEARGINFAIVVYSLSCMSIPDLHLIWDHGGQHGQESEEGKEEDRQEEEVTFVDTQYFC